MKADHSERRLREAIRLGATGALVGIALSAADAATLGGTLTVLCVLWLVWSLHRFGRLGPEDSATSRS